MANEPRTPRLAVLIDADNTSPRIATGLFEEIAKIGEASVRRIYGDFSSPRLKSWCDVIPTHAIMPFQNFANISGKNASAIALVIDAMDLLHSGRFDGFCLISSDSDFTRLAARIREQGIDVYGFGEQKSPASFRQACRRFIYTENLIGETAKPTQSEQSHITAATVKKPPREAAALIRKAIEQFDSDEGWVSLSLVGKRLSDMASDFDPRTYGHAKLSGLVQSAGGFELKRNEAGGYNLRSKSVAAPRVAKPK